MSLSRIIRHVSEGPAVFIGEKQHDAAAEASAEKTMRALFPAVALITTPDGARLIPIGEVHKMHARLKEECEAARKQGHEQGYQTGLNKGLDEARAVLHKFEGAIEDAISQRERMLERAKQKILDLVLQISKKVTFETFEIDREATVGLIENVINQLVDRSRLKIKVHPDHLPVVEQYMDRFLSGSTSIKEITFEADPRVRVGGCFIETPTGDIDARLTSQFEVIEETLRSGREER
jgi:flagellar assembly protein FliH